MGHRLTARFWPRSRMAWLVVILGMVLVLGNVGFLVFLFQQTGGRQFLSPRQGQSSGVVLVSAINAHRQLVATLNNDLLLLQDGHIQQKRHFADPIGGLAAYQNRYYVGTADGTVTTLSADFQPTTSFKVAGRIVGMQPAPAGGLYIGYGIGAFSSRFYVSHFLPAMGKEIFKAQANFTISAMNALDTQVAFGTANSQVGLVDGTSGKVLWSSTLLQPISALLILPDHQVLVGDDGGNVILLNPQGQPVWEQSASNYTIRSLVFDAAHQHILAGDTNGQLFVLDPSGSILTTQMLATSALQAFLPAGDLYTVVPRDGAWQTLYPAAVADLQLEDSLRPVWLGFDIVMLLAILVSVILAVGRLRSSSGRLLRNMGRARLAYIFTLPAIVLILMFSYYPAILAFFYSFTSFSLQSVTQFVGVQNYIDILTNDTYFRVGIVNMVLLVVVSILKTITFPLLAAELVFWLRNHVARYVFRTLFVLPAVVPGLVLTYMWRMVYDPNSGLLDQILSSLHLVQWQHAWLGEDATAIWAIIGVGFPFIGAFPFLIYLGGLLNISSELYEAASMDGASWLVRFVKIDVPLMLPQFRVLLFFVLAGTIQGFVDIFVLTKGGPGTATYVPALQMYLNLSDGHFGYASAIGMILFVIIVVPTVFVMRFRRDAVEGAA